MTKIASLLEAIRNSGQETFTRKEWMRITNELCDTKEEAIFLRNYARMRFMVDYVVRLTDKGKERLNK